MRLTATTFLTLDGVAQGPGGPDEDTRGGFADGGWLPPHVDADFGAYMSDVFARAGAFLLGRRTYETFAAYWPQVSDENPVAAALNGLRKHVVSSTLQAPAWRETTVIDGDVRERVAALRQAPGRELQVHGSLTLVRWLLAQELLDELRLLIHPVVLGDGIRLFDSREVRSGLALDSSRTSSSGILMCTYVPTGAPQLGAIHAGEEDAAQ